MACIYVLFSNKVKKFYVGSSREDSANSRLKAHNNRKTRSTKFGAPWSLVHEETYTSYTLARKRELFLKTGVGRSWIKDNFGRGARVV